jgi:hypothetical protein
VVDGDEQAIQNLRATAQWIGCATAVPVLHLL